ncbi:MAG: glyceraldehyde 3-phosphate dehydrogenase NAD-binding domain-containing protein, partial [Pseudomonadota bacterium]
MAPPRVAINGFGRIGRLTFRAFMEAARHDLEFVAINDLGSADMNALLLEYDTVHGQFPGEIAVDGHNLKIGGKEVVVLAEPDPEKLPWSELGVDIVMECTGRFAKRAAAAQHLDA